MFIDFANKFLEKYRTDYNPLCVGIDPHLSMIPGAFESGSMDRLDPNTVQAVADFSIEVIKLCAGKVHVVKPQAAFFEQFGWRGQKCLEEISEYAKSRGLIVVLDVKRNDIGSTAAAYSEAYLSNNSPFDAITINPYLGIDSITPFCETARQNNKGVFVLVKTSNPGSGNFQDEIVSGMPMYCLVAKKINEVITDSFTDNNWSPVGAVVGATYPEESVSIRNLLPKSIFLVPGFGAQGGGVENALAGFVRNQDGYLEGGIINSSRGVIFPVTKSSSLSDWKARVDKAISHASERLIDFVKKGSRLSG